VVILETGGSAPDVSRRNDAKIARKALYSLRGPVSRTKAGHPLVAAIPDAVGARSVITPHPR